MSGLGDHPHHDPGDGRTECERCGKFVWPVTHSCKGVPVTDAVRARYQAAHAVTAVPAEQVRVDWASGVADFRVIAFSEQAARRRANGVQPLWRRTVRIGPWERVPDA